MTRFPIPSTFRALFALAGLLFLGLAPEIAKAQIVTLFDVQQGVFSPDGDDVKDLAHVRYRLSSTATLVALTVFEADATTPVDTLGPLPLPVSAGLHTIDWDGERWDGSPAPEGAYVVTLFVTAAGNPDYVQSLSVFVDRTPPTVQITSVLPNPYAPGAPGSTTAVSFSFTIGNASPVSPGRIADELRSTFETPSGAAFVPTALTMTPPYTGASGNYVLAWNATAEAAAPVDGEYSVTLTLTDVAGYTSTSTQLFDVDARAPDVKATSLAENSSVVTVPDSLRGYAFDQRGVDSLMVRYATTRPYQSVAWTWVSNDTLRFSVPLADSFPNEGLHTVDFRAVDAFGRATTYLFSFRSDDTAPPAPTLDTFIGVGDTWTTNSYPLGVHVNDGGDIAAFVRIYRNNALIDSASTFASDNLEIDVPLVPGRNDLFAVLRDGAMNASPPSNTVTVTFDTGAGFFAPAPFGPGDAFDVNANGTAARCTLRLYDLLGGVVMVFDDDTPRQFYSFSWDGINGSSVDVRKGPLVAVASIEYADGTRDVFREVFLYDPHAP